MTKKTFDIPVDEYSSPIQLKGSREMTVTYLRHLMKEKGFRHVPILEDGVPVGIVTDRDISLITGLKFSEDFLASDIMVEDPYCVQSGTSLEEVAFEMSQRKIGSAIVLNPEGKADSIFTSVDGLNAIIEIMRGEVD